MAYSGRRVGVFPFRACYVIVSTHFCERSPSVSICRVSSENMYRTQQQDHTFVHSRVEFVSMTKAAGRHTVRSALVSAARHVVAEPSLCAPSSR